jgi:hypothetical protein
MTGYDGNEGPRPGPRRGNYPVTLHRNQACPAMARQVLQAAAGYWEFAKKTCQRFSWDRPQRDARALRRIRASIAAPATRHARNPPRLMGSDDGHRVDDRTKSSDCARSSGRPTTISMRSRRFMAWVTAGGLSAAAVWRLVGSAAARVAPRRPAELGPRDGSPRTVSIMHSNYGQAPIKDISRPPPTAGARSALRLITQRLVSAAVDLRASGHARQVR